MSEALFRTIQEQQAIERRTAVLESAEFAIMQIGVAAPAGNAAESVLFFDTVNDDLYINIDGVNSWLLLAGGGGIVAPHNLLSISHPDTVANVPTRGSLIVANATPAWDEFVLGAANTLLQVNVGGTDPAWQAFDWDNMAAAGGADMVHSHANAGEGGQLDWDNIWSDAVHSHANNAEGGQLDWDNIWSDAMHNHQNAAEGGNIAVAAISDLAYAVPALTLGIANAAGAANTVIRTDATILVFDAVVPNTIQPDDAAVTGASAIAARRDHEHGIIAAAPTANLSVSTANAEGAGTSFARNDHSHAITSSSNPGAAASLLATDVNGDVSVQDLMIAEFIIHAGDADTYIQAQADRWDHYAGNLRLLQLLEAAGDGFVTVNEDGGDVDFRVEASGVSDALQVLGSSGQIMLGALGAGIVQADVNGVLSSDFAIGSTTTFQAGIILDDNAGDSPMLQFIGGSNELASLYFDDTARALVTTIEDNQAVAYSILDDGAGDLFMQIVTTTGSEAIVFNNGGDDVNFRVEGVGEINALFVQGSDGLIGLGLNNPGSRLTLPNDTSIAWKNVVGNIEAMSILGTAGDNLDFNTNSVQRMQIGVAGEVRIFGNAYFGDILFHQGDVDTFINFNADEIVIEAGGVEMLRFTEAAADEIIFNEDGADINIRMEATGQANAFFLQGSDGNVGIGTGTPGVSLHTYVDNADTGTTTIFRVEQDGAGDAVMDFLLTATRQWLIGIDNSDGDKLKIVDATGGGVFTTVGIIIDTSGNVGIGTAAPASLMEWNFATEDLEFVDAGSAGATEQGWIEVELAGVQGFVRVYAAI